MKIFLFITLFINGLSCHSQRYSKLEVNKKDVTINDSSFVNITDYSDNFVLDLKYATADNFLKTKVYPCETCYLRYKTVKRLIYVSTILARKQIKIKLFDCYRPFDIQKQMWQLMPNPSYVADPSKGSIHNRGCAVDITLIDKNGTELDMGTPFDFFGVEAGHNFQMLDDVVKRNRLFLKKTMISNGFKSFDSEWWHYSLNDGAAEKISNFKWKCN